MSRFLREWGLPAVIGLPAGFAIAWATAPLGWPLGIAVWTTLGVGATVAIWVRSGGTVIGIGTWLVPALVLAAVVGLVPSPAGVIVLTIVLVLPVAGGVFPPIGRVHGWYTDRLSRWAIDWILPTDDRNARDALSRAMKPFRAARNDTQRTEDFVRIVESLRAHAENIRAVPAPDLGWERVIGTFAAAVDLYADMLQGTCQLDYDAARRALRGAREEWQNLLRSRSVGYRVLTHRFAAEPDAWDDLPDR